MKTMKVEKQFEYEDKIKQIIQIKADTELQYVKEDKGIRAIGPLLIKGTYVTNDNKNVEFQEVLQMDVLAPTEKLCSDNFSLHVGNCHAELIDHGIFVTIMMDVNGLIEEEVKKNDAKVEMIEEAKQKEYEKVEEFEDVFEDANTTYTSYRMIVAKKGDTYASIAQRYGVEESLLRECNHEKDIQAKSLIILP